MAPYQYRPLDTSKQEIRILHLQPGGRDDPIRVTIEHVPFIRSKDDEPWRMSNQDMEETQDGLPDNWTIQRTLEGQPMFCCWSSDDDEISHTSWQPPNVMPREQLDYNFGKKRIRGDKAGFEAVSYSWGLGDSAHDIEVVDLHHTESRGTIIVGPNLYRMLRYLQDPETNRTLWIDAICINQENLEEKSEQIRRMRDIFLFADRVVIWLGESSKDSTAALRTLDHIGKQIECTVNGVYMPSPSCSEREWYKHGRLLPMNRGNWHAILALLRRPYFERLWVLQELQMANQQSIVQCGEARFLWYNVRRGLLRCYADREHVINWAPMDWLRDIYNAQGVSCDLASESPAALFEVASMRKCNDPKDKVFGLLGLLPPKMRDLLKTRYESSVEDVYIEAFLKTVEVTQRLLPLDRASQDDLEDYPSWGLRLDQPIYERYSRRDNSMAASYTAAKTMYQPPDQLQIIGIIQGSIIAASSDVTVEAKTDYLAAQKLVCEYFPNLPEEEGLEAFLWVITMGDLRERFLYHNKTPTLHEAEEFIQQLLIDEDPEVSASYKVWYDSNLKRQQPGRFFVTDKGLLGCGASGLKSGDNIAVLLGYDYPVILRPVSSENSPTQFQHIGPAYVHGIMEGQAILGALPSPWTLVVLRTICGAQFWFHNSETGESQLEDPRLDGLPSEWEPIQKEDEARLSYIVQHYRNRLTGEIINSDPRLLPEALRARGVKLETLILV
jgi:hypothetical protein